MDKFDEKHYDLVVTGGGLAGLANAILVAREGYRVALFEKEIYPFHKVCGEYMSLESRELLMSIGVPLDEWQLPMIGKLVLTSGGGTALKQNLPLGGFGVSRYKLDAALVDLARGYGVNVIDGMRVHDILFEAGMFSVIADDGVYHSALSGGTFGKRSRIDLKWNRRFIRKKTGPLNNYIGVKYHAKVDHPRDTIGLHYFPEGYCGISPVEDGKTCICYLTSAANLRRSGNNIRRLEKEVLYTNPALREIFMRAEWLYERPLTISQISFEKREQVCDHTLLAGDAAGVIAPLCGNGMSMALAGGEMAAKGMIDFLRGSINRAEMESAYIAEWQGRFGRRLKAGRRLQALFAREWTANASIALLKRFPGVMTRVIKSTHG